MRNLTDLNREQDDWIERVARPLRRAETLDQDFESRLMAAVRAESIYAGAAGAVAAPRGIAYHPHGPRAAWRWFLRPRTIRVSPALGLAAAAALAALLLFSPERRGTPAGGSLARGVVAAGQRTDTVRAVQFVLVAPTASRVSLVGDFNNWDPGATPLRPTRTSGGVWMISVPLTIGRHQYAFIVDGTRWMTDPSAPTAVEDDFGVPNSVITVGERVT